MRSAKRYLLLRDPTALYISREQSDLGSGEDFSVNRGSLHPAPHEVGLETEHILFDGGYTAPSGRWVRWWRAKAGPQQRTSIRSVWG